MAADEEIKVKLGVEAGQFNSGMGEASKAVRDSTGRMRDDLGRLTASTDALEAKLDALSNKLRNVFAGLSFGWVAKEIVGVMSSFENLEIRLRSVMGSVEEGDKAFSWIKDFAKNTPFEVDGVTQAFMLLKNMGLDPMNGTLQAISDQASKAGQGQEGLMRISLALGQAFTKSKLQAEEMNQLLEAGVPAWDMLSRVSGKSTKELMQMSEKGELGRKAIKALIEEMGRMSAGGAGAMMASFSGQWSNLSDNIKNALDTLRKNGGLDGLTAGLAKINALFDQLNSDGTLAEWAANAGKAMSLVGETFMGIVETIGSTLGPLVSTIISGFNGILQAVSTAFGGESISGMQFFANVLKVIEIAVVGLSTGFKIAFEIIADVIERLVVGLLRFADTAIKALQLDFTGAKRAWDQGGQQLEEIHQKRMANILKITEGARDKIDAIIMRQPAENKSAPGAPAPAPRTGGPADIKELGTGKGESRVAKWETELQQEKAKGDEFRQYSLTQEQAFWTAKLRLTKAGTEERISVEKKVADLTIRIKREAFEKELAGYREQEAEARNNAARKLEAVEKEVEAVGRAYGKDSLQYQAAMRRKVEATRAAQDQINQINQAAAEARMNRDLMYVQAAQEATRQDYSNKAITNEQLLALERQYEEQLFGIKLKAAQDRLALINPQDDPVAYAQMKAQIENIETEHQARLLQIRQQAQAMRDDPSVRMFDAMQSSFETAITNMITQAQTLRQALSGIFKSIFSTFVTEMVSKPLAMAAMRFIRESALAKLFGFEQTALQKATSLEIASIKEAEASAVVGMEASKAAAGGAAAMAGIPIVGPALAVAAAAALFAMVMGFGKGGGGKTTTTTTRIPSAANGYDIPAGLNPLTQLHEKEMVLPQEQADVIRGMAGNGGGGAGAVHLHVTAMDSRDVKRFLLDNKSAVADALKSAVRDYKR